MPAGRPSHPPSPSLPWLSRRVLAAWLPRAERDEVLADLATEWATRRREDGSFAARRWLWQQTFRSLPALIGRSWWRGWTGFEPQANRMQPGGSSMESWIMDTRYAARRLIKRPTYALLAILTLALGVGGTAAIYTVMRGLLFDPLPYPAESRLAYFWNPFDWSEAELLYLQPNIKEMGFKDVAAFTQIDVTLESPDAATTLVHRVASSGALFDVLGASPELGRVYRESDATESAEPVVVLSHALWRQMGASPTVVGTRIKMGGIDRLVIGVMPERFWFPDPSVQAWTPALFRATSNSGNYAMVGRLDDSRSMSGTASPVAQVTRALGERFRYSAQWDKTKNARLTPLREALIGSMRPALLATVAAMGLILLIACANVAALMLGQVAGRSGELAVRAALGAGRQRIMQQLIVEALLVGAAGGVVGAAIAAGGFRLLLAALPIGPWAAHTTIDWSLFAIAITLALVASAAIAVAPIVALWRKDLREALGTTRTTTAGRGGLLEGGLVVGEIALAVVMAAGAALLIRSVSRLYQIETGMRPGGVAVVDMNFSSRTPLADRKVALRNMVSEMRTLPGVASVSAVQRLPLRGGGDNWGVAIEGKPELASSTTSLRIVTPGYFETMGIRLLKGRTFTDADQPTTETVIVINDALARKYFPGEDPIGRRIQNATDTTFARIVGVVANVAEGHLTDSVASARYQLYDQLNYMPAANTFVLRASGTTNPIALLSGARSAIQRVTPTAAVRETSTMTRVLAAAVGPARQIVILLSLLTGLAMLLGAIGVYGVVSHFVNQRKRDWGIRIALGQPPAKVIQHVVAHGIVPVMLGIGFGLAGAALTSKLLGALLYGVSATDPLALLGATSALFLVGLVAGLVPAYRASRVHPASVLREN